MLHLIQIGLFLSCIHTSPPLSYRLNNSIRTISPNDIKSSFIPTPRPRNVIAIASKFPYDLISLNKLIDIISESLNSSYISQLLIQILNKLRNHHVNIPQLLIEILDDS